MQKRQTANLNIYLIDICVAQHSVQYVKLISIPMLSVEWVHVRNIRCSKNYESVKISTILLIVIVSRN